MTLPSKFLTIQTAITQAMGPKVAVSIADPTASMPSLGPIELACMANAVPKRQREFGAGRGAMRQALGQLGHPPIEIPMGSDRAPILPAGFLGTVSHTDEICVAIVCQIADFRGIGVDLELAEPLPKEVIETVLTPHEAKEIDGLPEKEHPLMALRFFSAKEAVYKAQYAQSGAVFGFDVLEIAMSGNSFQARFCNDVPPFAQGNIITGTSQILGNHVISTAKIPH